MSDSFLRALDVEIADLERDLASNPTYLKLCEATRLRAMYDQSANHERSDASMTPDSAAQGGTRKRSVSPSRQAIVDGVLEILRYRDGYPTKTAHILDKLSAKGISVPGTNPKNNLSAMLSNSDLFVSHGRVGWTLAENETAADENSSDEVSAAAEQDAWAGYPSEPPAQGREAGPGGGT